MKKFAAIVFIIALSAALFMHISENVVRADGEIQGWVGYPGHDFGGGLRLDAYTWCYHTWLGNPNNYCVGIGLEAKYHDQGENPTHYDYTEAAWHFNSNLGANHYVPDGHDFWPNYPELPYDIFECDPWWEINGMMWSAGYAPDDVFPYWEESECPALVMWTQRSSYPDSGYRSFDPHASLVTGRVCQYFTDGSSIFSIEITVYPWDQLTAQHGEPYQFYWET